MVDHRRPWSKFEGQALDVWSFENKVQLAFIRHAKPVENAYVESSNGKFRDESLNEYWFVIMAQAGRIIKHWRFVHNQERSHQSLQDPTPAHYAAMLMKRPKTKEVVVLIADANPGPYQIGFKSHSSHSRACQNSTIGG